MQRLTFCVVEVKKVASDRGLIPNPIALRYILLKRYLYSKHM